MGEQTKTYATYFVDGANSWEQGHAEEEDNHFDPFDFPGYSEPLTLRYDPHDDERIRYAFTDASYLEMGVDGVWRAGLLSECGEG